MQSSVATLLLVTSAVVIACLVVNYAANTTTQAINPNNQPQGIRDIQGNLTALQQQLNNYSRNQTVSLPALPDSTNQETP